MVQVALDQESAVDAYTKANYESLALEFVGYVPLPNHSTKRLWKLRVIEQHSITCFSPWKYSSNTFSRLYHVCYFCWIYISDTDEYCNFRSTKMIKNSAPGFRTARILSISITVKPISRPCTLQHLSCIRVAAKPISSATRGWNGRGQHWRVWRIFGKVIGEKCLFRLLTMGHRIHLLRTLKFVCLWTDWKKTRQHWSSIR
jgi:hypothetical protein